MSYFYGPVPSRRLGFSLGLDLTPRKTCSFDCIYCQLGKISKKTTRRFSFIDLNKFRKELKEIIKKNPAINYITLSGSGEPTLHEDLDKIIVSIKKITGNKYPLCVITNSSLLFRKKVRKELKNADLIIPSLDAVSPSVFRKINRPYKGLNIKKIIKGLIDLRKEFKGKIWLEIMLVKGINDSLEEARKFKEIIEKIKPDKIQLNLPVRPAGADISLPGSKRIEKIRNIIGGNVEIVSSFHKASRRKHSPRIETDILNFLKRRPATLDDLAVSSGLNPNEVIKYLKILIEKKKIRKIIYQGKANYTEVSEKPSKIHQRPL